MAKNDNLTDFLTDVADAIRSKKGTSAKINPQNFANEIASIKTGGGGGGGNALPTAGVNDVTFYDYNGHILYSYSRTDFLALTEMPAPPTRDGLSFVEWSHTKDEAQEYVRLYRRLNIGACYTTSNGRTQMHFDVYSSNKTRKVIFTTDQLEGLTIYYGDGNYRLSAGAGAKIYTYNYPSEGTYVMELEPHEGVVVGLGYDNTTKYPLFGGTTRTKRNVVYPYGAGLRKLYAGDNISYYHQNLCVYDPSLEEVSLTPAPLLGQYAFSQTAIKHCNIPRGMESIGNYAFQSCSNMKVLVLPETVTSLSQYMLYKCYALQTLDIPSSVTEIPFYCCNECFNLEVVNVPKSVVSLGERCFESCGSLLLANFSQHETIPTFGTRAFYSINTNLKIVVPDALYDDWKAATGWSTYANYIVKASEYFVD